MNYDIETLSLDHFRLKSRRRKKRWQHTQREKSLIRLYREYDALHSQLHRLGYERREPPVQRGWKRFFVLCDRPQQRIGNTPAREAVFFQGILDKINTTQYSSRHDFKVKRRRRGKKVYEVRPQQLLTLWTWTFSKMKFTEEEAWYFDLVMTNEREGSGYRWMYVFREPWRFRLKIEPNIIRWKRIKDFDLERRVDEINRFIRCNDLWPKILKVMDGSYQWRGRYAWGRELPKYRYDPLKDRSFAEVLDEYMSDERISMVIGKPSDNEGFLFIGTVVRFIALLIKLANGQSASYNK